MSVALAVATASATSEVFSRALEVSCGGSGPSYYGPDGLLEGLVFWALLQAYFRTCLGSMGFSGASLLFTEPSLGGQGQLGCAISIKLFTYEYHGTTF